MPPANLTAPPAASLVRVDPAHDGQRLDNYLLATLKGVPRSHVYRLVRSGQVRVNRGRARPDRRLRSGDLVRIPPVARAAGGTTKPIDAERFQWLRERVLYSDQHLMVLDKPAGLAVHGGTGVQAGLIEALKAVYAEEPGLELVHRLDRDTSGCLLVARDRRTLLALHALLREPGGVSKRYRALVRGRWKGGERTVDAPLRRDLVRGGERMAGVDGGGRHAHSVFRPLRRFTDATLVEIDLATGRTHQARAHAAHIGHPVGGDTRYGDPEFNRRLRELGLRHQFLHAWALRFHHPVSGREIEVQAPLGAEQREVLDRLGRQPARSRD